jgi:hypothetical protein
VTSSGLIEGVDNAVLLATVTVVMLMSITIFFFFETVGRSVPVQQHQQQQQQQQQQPQSPHAPHAPQQAPHSPWMEPQQADGGPSLAQWFGRLSVIAQSVSGERLFDLLATPPGIVLVSASLLCATWLLFVADLLLWGVLFDRRACALLFVLSAIVVTLEFYHFNPFVNRMGRRLLDRDD